MTVATPSAHALARQRFDAHRKAFVANPTLRDLYAAWYERLDRHRPARSLGPTVEIGSGPGFAKDFLDDVILTDVVAAPWLGLAAAAEALPFGNASVGALILFDVLHHLPSPADFFAEAERVLQPGGRILICDPYISPLSFPVYAWLHEEGVDFSRDPFSPFAASQENSGARGAAKDPFAGNQAVATQLFFRQLPRFQRRFPNLRVVVRERLAGPTYPATGGFARRALLPRYVLQRLLRWEGRWPAAAFRWLGFRTLVVLELDRGTP